MPDIRSEEGKTVHFEQVRLRQYLKEYSIDLLHSLGYISPVFVSCPTVVSIPDLNFKAFGRSMSFSRRLMLNIFVKQAVARSNKIITISEFSRQEILRTYHISPQKIIVTHLAADSSDLKKGDKNVSGNILGQLGVNHSYFVAFTSTYSNKNIPRLIEAFLKLKNKKKLNQKLILIGHKYPAGEKNTGVNSFDENGDIIWTGYVARDQVVEILRQADFLVFPSFYEGFGLPVLEAMTCGVPVVCSKTASLPEVAGDAAVFFDPYSVEDIAEKIELVATNQQLRETLRQRGFENVEHFSWKRTAVATVAVYDDLLVKKR